MGMDENKNTPENLSVLAENLINGEVDFSTIDWQQTDDRGFTVLHCLLSVSFYQA